MNPIEVRRDYYAFWELRLELAQRRVEIAREELARLALQDQQPLFEPEAAVDWEDK